MNIKDFKWTEKRFGTRFATILKKLGGLSKDGTDGSIEYKDEQGNVTKLVTDSNFSSLLAKNGLIEVKWQELKDKRDAGKLIPGSLYRITDYNCTTIQENTRSAGHQFDIVLLALSENKLAEEGWAMMHDNIYDVTFDGGIKKCYIFAHEVDGETVFNIVDIGTMLGVQTAEDETVIDEANKSATCYMEVEELAVPDLQYNYFQNSNLSAWKVWYCLDNDTARFAWAGNLKEPLLNTHDYSGFKRNKSKDITISNQKYEGWSYGNDNDILYTLPQELSVVNDVEIEIFVNPISNVHLYMKNGANMVDRQDELISVEDGEPGRGVIYRLIDEWNNDVPYDFKNIQFLRKLDGGQIDAQGTDTYCYTFTLYDVGNKEYKDASIFAIDYVNDEGGITPCYNNSINSISAYNGPIDYTNKYSYVLPCIIFLSSVESGSYGWGTYANKLFDVHNSAFEGNCSANIVLGGGRDYTDLTASFVCYSKRASMEFI